MSYHSQGIRCYFFLQKGRTNLRIPLVNSFSRVYSKSAFSFARVKSELILCIFERKNKDAARNEHSSCSVVQRRTASHGVVQGWDGTYLPRPSHDDGTFTQGKLPQIIYFIFYILYYILYIKYYILYIIY